MEIAIAIIGILISAYIAIVGNRINNSVKKQTQAQLDIDRKADLNRLHQTVNIISGYLVHKDFEYLDWDESQRKDFFNHLLELMKEQSGNSVLIENSTYSDEWINRIGNIHDRIFGGSRYYPPPTDPIQENGLPRSIDNLFKGVNKIISDVLGYTAEEIRKQKSEKRKALYMKNNFWISFTLYEKWDLVLTITAILIAGALAFIGNNVNNSIKRQTDLQLSLNRKSGITRLSVAAQNVRGYVIRWDIDYHDISDSQAREIFKPIQELLQSQLDNSFLMENDTLAEKWINCITQIHLNLFSEERLFRPTRGPDQGSYTDNLFIIAMETSSEALKYSYEELEKVVKKNSK